MRFFQSKYIKILSLSLVFGALAMLFVHDKLWALPPQKEQSSALVNAGNADEKKRLQGKTSLDQQKAKNSKRDGIDEKSIQQVIESEKLSRFTQTEAQLQLPEVRDLIERNTDVAPYLNIVSASLVQEMKHKAGYYAFYHTTENSWRVAQDVYTRLYSYYKEDTNIDDSFKFLRFGLFKSLPKARDFLLQQIEADGLVDDKGELAAILLSVNLSLFGNVGFPSEFSWGYFLREKKNREPDRSTYEDMMKYFGLSEEYVDELVSLANVIQTEQKMILQIFVPKNKVDDIGYLAWASGIPAHQGVIDWVKTNVKKKSFKYKEGKAVGAWVLDELAEKFKKQGEKNPLYRDLVQSIKEGDFSVKEFLKIYCNKPWALPSLNNTQARLLLTPEILLNPNSGIKMYRYSMASHKQLTEYHERLDEIIDKIIKSKQK